jgi:hypothetical protein
MRKNDLKLWLHIALALAFVASAGGCGGGDGDSGSVKVAGIKTAVIGSLSAENEEMAKQVGILRVPFDESEAEGYNNLIIAHGELGSIQNETPRAEAICAVLSAGAAKEGRVVVEKPTGDDVERLGALLGIQPIHDLPEGGTYDYYGIGTQADGDILIFAHVNPAPSVPTVLYDPETGDGSPDDGKPDPDPSDALIEDSDDAADDKAAHAHLAEWLYNPEGTEGKPSGVSPKADDPTSDNLIDIAQQYIVTLSATTGGKSYFINNYIVSAHSFAKAPELGNDEPDIYYVHQECIMDGSAGYVSKWAGTRYTTVIDPSSGSWYIGQGDVVDNYVEEYDIGSYLNTNGATVQLLDPDPQATNNVSTKTVNSTFSIGANVGAGYQGGKDPGPSVSGSLSFGATFGSSYTYDVQDVTIEMLTADSGMSPIWHHNFKIPAREGAGHLQSLYPPADLSHSVYKPNQLWIWRVKAADRSNVRSYRIDVRIVRGAVLTRYSGSQGPKHLTVANEQQLGNVTLPLPPLLAIDKTVFTLDNTAHTGTDNVAKIGAYQENWAAKVSGSASWLTATPSGGELYIQAAANTTGAARTATISVTRTGGAETGVITVTQLQ